VKAFRLTSLLLLALTAGCASPLHAQRSSGPVRFECIDGQTVDVQISGSRAKVRVEGTTYALRKRPSSIGIKFVSSDAALMIDESFAAFVAEIGPRLRQCRSAGPIAVR
jgi:hypothetical protein